MNKAVLVIVLLILVFGVGIGALVLLSPKDEEPAIDESEEQRQQELVDIPDDDSIENTEDYNLADLIILNEDLKVMSEVINTAELGSELTGETMYTVFVPTDSGFSDVQETLDMLLLPENKEQLQNVLKTHIVEGRVLSSQLEEGQTLTTLSGTTLTVRIENGEAVLVGPKNEAYVIRVDTQANNGILHVIDSVLLP